MPRQHQVLAVLTGKKSKVQEAVTALYQEAQKPARFEGFVKEYRPLDDADGEKLPSDRKNIPTTSKQVLDQSRKLWSTLFNLVATQDRGNCHAHADISINGQPILKDIPVSTLIFLEKRLEDIRSLLAALPVLPPEKSWKWSDDANCYVSGVEQTRKTGKVRKAHVLYDATTEHPAQVDGFTVDETVGWWHTTHQSGALQAQDKADKLERVDKLIDAVKIARGTANELFVDLQVIADPLFDYILKGAKPSFPVEAT